MLWWKRRLAPLGASSEMGDIRHFVAACASRSRELEGGRPPLVRTGCTGAIGWPPRSESRVGAHATTLPRFALTSGN